MLVNEENWSIKKQITYPLTHEFFIDQIEALKDITLSLISLHRLRVFKKIKGSDAYLALYFLQ